MLATPAVAPPKNELLADALFRLRVEHYHFMVDSGVFTEDDAVELLDGWIVKKMPKNRLHAFINNLVVETLSRLISAEKSTKHFVDVQNPITLATSEPEPDAAVVRGQNSDFQTQHPTGADVAIVVEVSDATLRRDQTWKKQLYADAGIPVYWIVNVPERMVEVYSEPSTERTGYRQLRTYVGTEEVPVVVDGEEIGRFAARTLFPS